MSVSDNKPIVIYEEVSTPLGKISITRDEVLRLNIIAESKYRYLSTHSNMPENEVVLWRDILVITTHWLNCLPKEG